MPFRFPFSGQALLGSFVPSTPMYVRPFKFCLAQVSAFPLLGGYHRRLLSKALGCLVAEKTSELRYMCKWHRPWHIRGSDSSNYYYKIRCDIHTCLRFFLCVCITFFLCRTYAPPLPFQRHMFSLLPLSTLTAFPCSTIDTTPPGAAGQILGNAALIVGEGGCVIEVLRRRETGWLKRLL